ncbi:MAG: DEAD/DEAH box helicase family protein [Planctomycetota bacterium]
MELKRYQEDVVERVERYLRKLAGYQAEGERYASRAAWDDLNLSATSGPYHERKNGLGKDLPQFCIKVPTGGGKTLIATQVLGSIYRTVLQARRGAGIVLWVVPSDQIYRDTLARLRDRDDLYRIALEHAIGRRIELWEKQDIRRITPGQVRECLNILVIKLASANRQTKDDLKFFQDGGGNVTLHFPAEDNAAAQAELLQRFPNLDTFDDPGSGPAGRLIKTSVGNLVRLHEPPVILDEQQTAATRLARETLEGLNPSLIVQLSATPKAVKLKDKSEIRPNMICRVTGQDLLDEEMIKLPMNIAASGESSWQNALTEAADKRNRLAKEAADHALANDMDRLIRPIVLVQAERTGKDQRGKKVNGRQVIHTEDVREYLQQRLGVPGTAIAVKSSATDDIEGIDLMDPGCPIEWIITKDALGVGWDCPFAYILVSLNNTGSAQSMTQLIGRVLRQPYQRKTGVAALDESYVYCLHKRAATIASEVKSALEAEGFEGDIAGLIQEAGEGGADGGRRTIKMQPHFRGLYREPFEGEVYLPRFCVKTASGNEPLDYFKHLLHHVDIDAFDYDSVQRWKLDDAIVEAKNRYYRVTLGEDLRRVDETAVDVLEKDPKVLAWLVASLPFEHLSFKQLRRIVMRVHASLLESELRPMLEGRLSLVKTVLSTRIADFIERNLDQQTEAVFRRMHEDGTLRFYLHCEKCRFRVPPSVTIRTTRRLTRDNGDQVERTLFDYQEESDLNGYEKKVALVLDRHERVLWWYRNLVGPQWFEIQGWKRPRVRPDLIAQSVVEDGREPEVWVVEAKGSHLEGSSDTTYKRELADCFEDVGRKVKWQQLGHDFSDHRFRFQVLDQAECEDTLQDLLVSNA